MRGNQFSVLVVDDSEMELDLTVMFLRQYFQVFGASNGLDALEIMAREKPVVVLLDINMPGMSGYDVCRKIRETNKLVKIIFVSANDELQEILDGYDAGGNDYVVKPYTPDILLSKVNQAVRLSLELVQVSKQAEGLAMEAMMSLGEFGIVINFLKSSFRVGSLDALAVLMFGFLERFELEACVQLRTQMSKANYASIGTITPIEEELLSRVAALNVRIAERGQRLFINYDHATLMIKNMPTDNEFKMGRFRDNLAIMLEGADEKLCLIELEEETQIALGYIQSFHQRIERENSIFVENTIRQIERAFANLGMTEEQEESLVGLITKSQVEFENNFKDTRLVEEQINSILKKIKMKQEAQPPSLGGDSIDFL